MTPESSPQLQHESQTKVPPRYLLCIFLEPMSKPPRHLLQPLCQATWNKSGHISRRHGSPPQRHKAFGRLAGRVSCCFRSLENLKFKKLPFLTSTFSNGQTRWFPASTSVMYLKIIYVYVRMNDPHRSLFVFSGAGMFSSTHQSLVRGP